ncbi:MAG: phage terminase small subunit P27 family [Planctomycetota bacterium]
MGKRGPAPKPTAIRRAEGTVGRGASRMNKREAKPASKLPDPPNELSADARKVWRRLGNRLLKHGLVTNLDEVAFAGLCDSYATWLRLIEKADALGGDIVSVNGQLVPNPARSAALKQWEVCRRLLGEFGMTPARRVRVEADDPSGDAKPDADNIDSYLRIAV